MSAYTTLETQLVSAEHIVLALRDLGFPVVELDETGRSLVGWQGDRRAERAQVIVRREHIGEQSNDIGFARGHDGTFVALNSEFDREHCGYGDEWLGRLTQRYAYHVARSQLEDRGFDLVEETVDNEETIRLVLRRAG